MKIVGSEPARADCNRVPAREMQVVHRVKAAVVKVQAVVVHDGPWYAVAVIPASYFDNLGTLLPQFEALTGIKVRIEKVPPGQIRQKAMLVQLTVAGPRPLAVA